MMTVAVCNHIDKINTTAAIPLAKCSLALTIRFFTSLTAGYSTFRIDQVDGAFMLDWIINYDRRRARLLWQTLCIPSTVASARPQPYRSAAIKAYPKSVSKR